MQIQLDSCQQKKNGLLREKEDMQENLEARTITVESLRENIKQLADAQMTLLESSDEKLKMQQQEF